MTCENCSICLEPLNGDIRTLGCGHQFHTACMRRWERQNHGNCTCPNCRGNVDTGEPQLRRRRRRNADTRWPSPPGGLNLVPPWLMHAQNIENAGFMAASELMDNIEHRISRSMQNMEQVPDFDTKICLAVSIFLIMILGSIIGITVANDTCMCQHRWPPDATMITVDGWFGGTTTYHRPPMCTNWC